MFCRNCGKELIGTPDLCMSCGAQPMNGRSFCNSCGAPTTALTEICMKCGTRLSVESNVQSTNISNKSRLVTVLLTLFLGMFGAHRFYIGKTGSAVAMLVTTIIGIITAYVGVGIVLLVIMNVWFFADLIRAIAGVMKDKEGRLIKNW